MDSKAIDEIINNAKNALNHYMSFTQEKIDYIIKKSSDAGLDHHVKLAKEAVKETGLGIYEDKVAKNIAAVESCRIISNILKQLVWWENWKEETA